MSGSLSMITDPTALSDSQAAWTGVRKMLERMQSVCVTTFADGAIAATALPQIVYNLPLLLACDVLRQVLQQLKREGRFASSRVQLGPLADAAKTSLPWLDWQGIRDSIHRRNTIAHDGQLLDADICVSDIRRIEHQLVAWNVISP